MICYYKKERDGSINQIEQAEKGCWINIYPPFHNESLQELSETLNIPIDFLIDSLDIDERSRYEKEDGAQLIVLNIPIKNQVDLDLSSGHEALYITIPIGIIKVDYYILTISAFKNPVIDYFLTRTVKNFETSNHINFILQLFDRTVYYFLHYLKSIDNQRNLYEKELYHSSRNKELSKLMNLQKSLVYFVTTLRDNELMLLRMQRTDFLRIVANYKEEAEDFFEDIIIDMSQAQEMSQIYADILNGTMDALASIISNNMNTIMKRLTSITIILMVPTLVASFYGMNVPLWGNDNPYAFLIIMLSSSLVTAIVVAFFMRQRLF